MVPLSVPSGTGRMLASGRKRHGGCDGTGRPAGLSVGAPRHGDDRADQRLHPGNEACRGTGHPYRYAGYRHRRGPDSGQGRHAAWLFRPARGQGAVSRGAGERGDLRRPRVHQGRVPAVAKAGYFAVATEYYARLGDLSKMTDISRIISDVISKAPDDQYMADMDATAAWAVDHSGDAGRIGVMGFCRGGRQTWLYAAHSPHLKAAAA